VGLFTAKHYSYSAKESDSGIFMGDSRGELFGCQIVSVLIILLWVVGTSSILFMILRKLHVFRVAASDEESGLDVSKHGGSAYSDSEVKNVAITKPQSVSSTS
jgi:Amt family ammonium transporter